jgi:NAD(P)-dependent dehydrogenase (short-subunit alcohol dehydrogenase family)
MPGTAVVTGANSGIGLETCRRLLADGWTVHALDRATDALDAIGDTAGDPGAGPQLRVLPCDITDENAVDAAFRRVAYEAGHLDALVCSAGVLRTGPLLEMAAADFDAVFQVNTRGAWLCARAALPLLASAATARKPGRMVMVGSVAAVRPKVAGGAYAASKAALAQLVRVMAVEAAPLHIRVNAVAPSTVDTPMIRNVGETSVSGSGSGSGYRPSGTSPLGRVAAPEDVVHVIRFLLSPPSDYVNGATIPVDGGISAAVSPPPP